jgi:hypothetical protein
MFIIQSKFSTAREQQWKISSFFLFDNGLVVEPEKIQKCRFGDSINTETFLVKIPSNQSKTLPSCMCQLMDRIKHCPKTEPSCMTSEKNEYMFFLT